MKKYFIFTYGCQMNVHESEKIAGILSSMGYEAACDVNDSDIAVFNTCCIRENAEEKVYGHIGTLKKRKLRNPNFIIAVGGCMTQQKGAAEKLKNTFPFIDIVFGTHNLEDFQSLLERRLQGKKSVVDVWEKEENIKEGTPKTRTSYPNAWVNIMYGCNNFCSYCIVPYVRGRERSRKVNEIVKECEELVSEGYREITLLGQNVNSYGLDLKDGTNFPLLLKKVSEIEGKFRIRFMTNHPKDFSDELIEIIKSSEKICKCVHLPVQSGSDRILKLMNRKYTREWYEERLSALKKAIPDCAVTTDVMVGFPTETEEDFSDTFHLLETARFKGAFTFIYSPRENTPAAKMDGQIPYSVSANRIERLISLQNDIGREDTKKYVGQTVEILVEGFDEKKNVYLGRDEYGKMAYFPSKKDVIGEFLNVKITKTNGISLFGEIEG